MRASPRQLLPLLAAALLGAVAAARAAAAAAAAASDPTRAFTDWQDGYATFYGGPQARDRRGRRRRGRGEGRAPQRARARAQRPTEPSPPGAHCAPSRSHPAQDSSAQEYDTKISTGSCGYGDIDPKCGRRALAGRRARAYPGPNRRSDPHAARGVRWGPRRAAAALRGPPPARLCAACPRRAPRRATCARHAPAPLRRLWPFFLVAGLSPSNPMIPGLAQRGCGSCVEIECVGPSCHPGVGPVTALLTDECASRCKDNQARACACYGGGVGVLRPSALAAPPGAACALARAAVRSAGRRCACACACERAPAACSCAANGADERGRPRPRPTTPTCPPCCPHRRPGQPARLWV
jgi:hypothetical protein